MSNNYDVIVIGAGNAGLSAAATVANQGLKTLVIERNSYPGGCATSFRRGRFEFEVSLHELANIGTTEHPGSVRKMFEEFGINLNWFVDPHAFRVITGGKDGYDVTMPIGVEAFCDEMECLVPGSRESVQAVFDLAEKANAAFAYLSQGRPDMKVMLEEHGEFLRASAYTMQECLDALGMPKKAQQILATYWSYIGAPIDEADFLLYAVMLHRYIKFGPALPEKFSNEISLGIEKSIRDHGGEIWYNMEVSQILVKDGEAYGVVVDGKPYFAQRIICNCHPEIAYGNMLQSTDLPERAVQLSNARNPGMLFFTVNIGLNRSYEELGIKDSLVFLFDSPDPREQYDACNSVDTSFSVANCLNMAFPESSPEGTSTMFFLTLFTEEAWGEVKPEDYKKVKNRIAKRMIEDYEKKVGVELQPYIEEISIASPATFARYLNTPNGTPYGYQINLWDSMISRMMHGSKERFVKNLYFVGAHGERAAGFSSTYANGRSVGQRAAKGVISHDSK